MRPVTENHYPGTVTHLSRVFEQTAQLESGNDPLSISRSTWFGGVAPLVECLRGLNPQIPINELWAAASHIVAHPEYSSKYLKAIGATTEVRLPTDVKKPFRSGINQPHPEKMRKRKPHFTFIDLFAGVGGFNLALSRAGGSCVFSSEWDNSARITYGMNFGSVPFGDIRSITRVDGVAAPAQLIKSRLPKCDVLSAGFPCQPFSQAGVSSRNFHGSSHGLECEAQGTLFEDILIVANAIQPKILLLENVSNLARHDKGRTINVIIKEIEKNGYILFPKRSEATSNDWATIDSQSVVAQRRKRVYMVCVRKDLVRKFGDFRFPEFTSPEVPHALADIISGDSTLSDNEKFRQYSISSVLWSSHQLREERHRLKGNGFRIGLVTDLSGPAPTLVARYYKDGKDCLIPNKRQPWLPPRMLTPRECAALQTFPADFWIPPKKSPAYKQFGNSITVEVASKIAAKIVKTYFVN